MAYTPETEDTTGPVPRRRGRRRSLEWPTAMGLLFGLAVLAAACGGGKNPGAAGTGPNKNRTAGSPSGALAEAVAYAHCMRNHGVPDFPDPVTSPGGGIAFQRNGGPGSDLNDHSPTFEAADQACRSLMPGGG